MINSVSIFKDVKAIVQLYHDRDFYNIGVKLGGILEKIILGNIDEDNKPTDDEYPTTDEEPEIVDFLAFNIRRTKSDAV